MSGPLHGVRVLDLTTVVMGPYATQILADFGADVIKVEPPEGDVIRQAWPYRNPGMGSIFLNTNRNKRSVVLDLKQGAAGIPWLLHKQGAAEPRYAPMIVADRSVGQQVASAVSAALYFRERTGKGQRVDVPMFEHLLQIVLGDHLGGATFEPQVGEPGYARMLAPDRRPYQTKDGYVCTLIYNDKQWRAFAGVIGKPEILARPEYATQEARS